MSLRTTEAGGPEDIRDFFDRLAPRYRECHGSGERLLRYRLRIIRRLLGDAERGSLMEIGCGTGLHLFALAAEFRRLHGTDLSPEMIRQAEQSRIGHPCSARIHLSADPAETLASVDDATADVVLCVGALEHMPDKPAVLRQVQRVLRRGGAFLCLTPNADYVWYATVAPRLGLATRHLSSDRFVNAGELTELIKASGLFVEKVGYWTFIPRGDMPKPHAWLLAAADLAGQIFRIPSLRGGLFCRASKP